MQIQKRYIYAGIVSALLFVITYGLMDFNIFLSLLFTVILYVGGIFLFKGKDIRTFSPENVNKYYFLGSKCANQANYIDDRDIKSHVENITTLTDEIIVSLSQRPKKVEQVFDFFDYYLDVTYKILYRYNLLMKSENKTSNDKEFMKHTKEYLIRIEEGFEKQLANMKEARIIDIATDIRMFEKTMGIKKSDVDVEVGEINEIR